MARLLGTLIFTLVLVTAASAPAVTVSIVDRDGTLLSAEEIAPSPGETVGALSIHALENARANGRINGFEAYESGVVSINGHGNDLEIISGNELRAWGWCFALNGELPETLPDATAFQSQGDLLEWFYGYAHYLNGEWIGQCLRSEGR